MLNQRINLKYEVFKAQQLREAYATRILGIPLDAEEKTLERFGGYRPFVLCHCVHDSPSSPCLCKAVHWLQMDKIIESGTTERRNSEGHEIQWFEVHNDARVIVEKVSSLDVRGLGTSSDPRNGGPTVIYSVKQLIDAFKVGVAIGTFLNEKFDLSDKISDWLIETFGPWPWK